MTIRPDHSCQQELKPDPMTSTDNNVTKSQGPTAQDPERNCKSDVPGPSCWLPHLRELENPLRGVKSRRLEWGSRKKSVEDKLCSSPRKAEKWRDPVPLEALGLLDHPPLLPQIPL